MADLSTQTRSPHYAKDAAVKTYTAIHLPRIFTPWARILLEVVPAHPGQAVLDVATGPGTVAREAAVAVGGQGRVTGVDISPAMLAVGRGWPTEPGAATIDYLESSASSLPFPDASFDVAYCQQGLQHVTDPVTALTEMRRVLKPNGRLGVALWAQSPFALFREIASDLGMSDEGPHPSLFGRDAAELEQVLRDLGWQDVQVQTREHVAVLEGGISQALDVAEATSAGAILASQTASRRQEFRDAIAHALQPRIRGDVVSLPSTSNIVSARTGL